MARLKTVATYPGVVEAINNISISLEKGSPSENGTVGLRAQRPTLWLVVPYHPGLVKAFNEAMSRFNKSTLCRALFKMVYGVDINTDDDDKVPVVRIAWKRSLQNLKELLST